MKTSITKLLTSMVVLSLSAAVVAQTKFGVQTFDVKKQQIKIPVKETIKPTYNFGSDVYKNSCSEFDYNVNTTDEGDDIEESCSADRCTIRAAIREAVIDSVRCNDNAERKIILQPNAQYNVYRFPLPPEFGGPSHPGGYRISRTAFPSFNQGKYRVIGNGATIEREPRGRGDNPLRFFDINSNADVTLEDLTLKNGLTSGSIGPGYTRYKTDGGAIYNNGQLTVKSVTFHANQVPIRALAVGVIAEDVAEGGAIYNGGRGSLIIYDSTFTRNSATDGAAIANHSSGIFSIGRTSFEDHYTLSTGAMISNRGDGQINGSNFSNNLGGYVIRSIGVMQINDSSFTRNGIEIHSGSNSSIPAVIGAWRVVDDGYPQKMIIRRSTFAENILRNGVVLINSPVNVEVSSSTIANNTSGRSSIICMSRTAKVNINGSTIANNINVNDNIDYPTGITVSEGCALQLSGTVITSDIGATCDLSGAGVPALFSSSFSDDARCRTGTVGNAMLNDLTDNGGSTQTMMPRLGSPLIDVLPHNYAGSETMSILVEDAQRIGNDYYGVMDQRFLPRYIDGLKDIGAVERQSSDL